MPGLVMPESLAIREQPRASVENGDADHVANNMKAENRQWPDEKCENMAVEASRWKRQGKKLVFLPQAFGPFSTDWVRSAFSRVLEQADLVFARDPLSYDHLVRLGGSRECLRLGPDFTNLLPGAVPTAFATHGRRVAIVPNVQMMKKTDADRSAKYIPFLADCIRQLQMRGLEPFLLVHSVGDETLISPIHECLDTELEIVRPDNPIYTKGILGTCSLAVA